MPRHKTPHIPTYRLKVAKPSRRRLAVVTIGGRDHYLGDYGTRESRAEYDRLIAEHLSRRELPAVATPSISLNEVFLGYLAFAQTEYGQRRSARGTINRIHSAIRFVRRLYGTTPAAEFDVERLSVVRDEMIRAGLSRSYIRDLVNIVRDIFRWAATKKLVVGSVWHDLLTLKHLQAGSGRVAEPRRVRPVDGERIRAIRRFLSKQVRAILAIQRLTGARPGELTIMRLADIDMTRAVWVYTPRFHKTEHKDCDRQIPLGPRAQRTIRIFMPREPQSCLFSPAEADTARRAKLSANRRTPLSCGNRPGSNRKAKPKRKPLDFYTPQTYRTAIHRACDRAFPPPAGLSDEALEAWQKQHRFFPYQVRHAVATSLAERHGSLIAQTMLGHRSARTTERYVHRTLRIVEDVVRKIG